MTWRDDLQRVTLPDGRRLIGASFRGVPFLVQESDRSGGRRTVTHEFPGRDNPYIEDLGRRARTFRVDGYVLGDDYLAQRDQLLEALEDVRGPGELRHPYHGIRRAVCTSVSVRESSQDGGRASFAIEFSEAPEQTLAPVLTMDYPELVDQAATAARTTLDAATTDGYDIEGLPSWSFTRAEAALERAAEVMREALAPITFTTQEAARLQRHLDEMVDNASSLVRAPADATAALADVLEAIAETAEDAPGDVAAAFMVGYGIDPAFGLNLDEPEAATPNREQEAANVALLLRAIRGTLAIEAARLTAQATYTTLEEATVQRDLVVAALDEQAESASDDVFAALMDLRAAVVRAVPGDADLAREVTVSLSVATPSLVLAHRLYGSVELEADIVDRNGSDHPGFLAGDLTVLSDG